MPTAHSDSTLQTYCPNLLSDPEVYGRGVPYQEYARLRREAPVSWVEETPQKLRGSNKTVEIAGGGYWAVTRHASIITASRRTETFSSAAQGAFFSDPKSREDLERSRQLLINMDAPEHIRIRKIVTSAFTPRAINELHHNIRVHARSIVKRVVQAGEFDAVADMAAEMPLLVLADMLGMPPEDRNLFLRWSNQLVGFDDPDYGGGSVEVYQRTFHELFDYAEQLAEAKRLHPTSDLISMMVNSTVDGRRLTESEFCNMWVLLVIGGNESTRHLLSGMLLALSEWPAERDKLAANPELIPLAVEELLRWVSPVMQFRRTVMQDMELDGQKIFQGDKVVLYYISANMDEAVFETPEKLDLMRKPNPHLAFGIGPHFCLGAHLARLEAICLLEALLPHLPSLYVKGPVIRLKSNFMNGIKSMPAQFTA